ncbi:MAG TPA: hypothetical protein VK492_09540 [Chitinophagaceae bacterium]|nr:hypothetical protein [Chitinophagaceae bacterium]
MEVHAHSHSHGKKNWKQYFWEFLMLFLAVFCGFLAENQREHYVEHQREKQFIQTLLNDLENDTVNFNRSISTFKLNVERFDSLKTSVKNPQNPDEILNAYKASTLPQSFSSFNYSDRTIEQLRSSGNFRLIRNSEVSDALIEYDRYIRNTYLGIEKILTEESIGLGEKQNEILDYDLWNYFLSKSWQQRQLITADSLAQQPKLLTDNEQKLQQYYNSLGMWRNWCNRMAMHSGTAKKYAIKLMNLVKKEYHLE